MDAVLSLVHCISPPPLPNRNLYPTIRVVIYPPYIYELSSLDFDFDLDLTEVRLASQ